MLGTLKRRLRGEPPRPWTYRDFGSLVPLGAYSAVGSLMGRLIGGALFIEGYLARIMYISLYKMHLYALHGFARVFFENLVRMSTRRTDSLLITIFPHDIISEIINRRISWRQLKSPKKILRI